MKLTDEEIFHAAEPFGAFEYGDAQGHKRIAFARAIEAAVLEKQANVDVEPVCEVYRYGKDSSGREWHGIHWYDANVDVPAGTKLVPASALAALQAENERLKNREWISLTFEEVSQFANRHAANAYGTVWPHDFASSIEAALKDRNT